MKAILKSD